MIDEKASSNCCRGGAFNGLGATLCKLFAAEGFHVCAAGRTAASLQAIIGHIAASVGSA